jgi:hypothetical protein
LWKLSDRCWWFVWRKKLSMILVYHGKVSL